MLVVLHVYVLEYSQSGLIRTQDGGSAAPVDCFRRFVGCLFGGRRCGGAGDGGGGGWCALDATYIFFAALWPAALTKLRLSHMEKLFDAAGQARLERAARTPPTVFVQDGFLSDEDCREIATLAEPLLKRATVCGDKAGLLSAGRTGSNCWVKHVASERTASIVARVAALLQLPPAHAESLQVIHYGPTQQYRPHYDGWLHDGSAKAQRTLRRGGQRIWTALCYLNTVLRGGSTRFTKLDIDVRALPPHGVEAVHSNATVRGVVERAVVIDFRSAPSLPPSVLPMLCLPEAHRPPQRPRGCPPLTSPHTRTSWHTGRRRERSRAYFLKRGGRDQRAAPAVRARRHAG